MSAIDLRPSTPPHQPNFGIHMSTETIKRLVHLALPGQILVDIENLPSSKSYNNRIYFLKTLRQPSDTQQGATNQDKTEFVLKINGRVFGADKIQNEVSCLRLLEVFCHGIPAPRVIAWSQDGSKMEIPRKDGTATQQLDIHASDANNGGWTLMTRAPGESIDLSEHNNDTIADLAVQLADHVANWRHNIPSQINGGNLRFQENEYKSSQPDITLIKSGESRDANLVIRGILGDGLETLTAIPTIEEFYRIRMEHKLNILETVEAFVPNRSLKAPVRKFLQEVLPILSTLNTKTDGFIFTHFDLSPRNVLISGKPPQITGIVDFEFSGFFPSLYEYLNDYIENSDDWPKDIYEVYLKRLEENGVPTPLESVDKEHWELNYLLEELVQGIAPWYLPGEFKGKELEEELDKAKVLVTRTWDKLSRKLAV
ncbi:hypothetical protein NW762_010345 [Fusarium torreyae]|uniref:Aminoglycoside phosphotransferase domain-containing protein n=1 Tax=Fusarium torreyae TaxID=1237075 RepID=A0A9W8RVN6_9HYPO|nr:hypothetical protein NW762_010345 [Fusarium torreyae]